MKWFEAYATLTPIQNGIKPISWWFWLSYLQLTETLLFWWLIGLSMMWEYQVSNNTHWGTQYSLIPNTTLTNLLCDYQRKWLIWSSILLSILILSLLKIKYTWNSKNTTLKLRNDKDGFLTVKMKFLATMDFNKQAIDFRLDYD